MKKGMLIICLLALLCGCKSPETLQRATYNTQPGGKYPAVTLVINQRSLQRYNTAPDVDPYKQNLIENDAIYNQAGINKSDVDLVLQVLPTDTFRSDSATPETTPQSKSVVGSIHPSTDPDMPVILKSLRTSGLFERVDINNDYAEFILNVSLSHQIANPGFKHFCKTMLSAGTLFLYPVAYDYHFSMNIDVLQNNRSIASYEYQEDLHDYLCLLEDLTADQNEMIEVLLTRFYSDLQKDQLFKSQKETFPPQHSKENIARIEQ